MDIERSSKVAPRIERPRKRVVTTSASKLSSKQKDTFKTMLEDLMGTRGAFILDQDLNILGKVPITELPTTIKSLNNTAYAVVFDGVIDRELAKAAEVANVKFLVGMDSKIRPNDTRCSVLTVSDL